jgi:UDP-GlcNAc:undecaprenyl-phosphate/decaprenyl-phosphate GlcNAc-1-phosphate transferase
MNMLTQAFIAALEALIIALILIPAVRIGAIKFDLVDKPNARKVHAHPVPLVGGISIAITTVLALILSPKFLEGIQNNIVWLTCAIIMLAIGLLDDRFDIKPLYRLIIQMSCAYAVVASGIRIQSFYGLFGIQEIPDIVGYVLTIIVITGVVNAYNLMDGIDGLLGGLTLIGVSVLGIISYQYQQYELTIFYSAVCGAIIGFLRYNLSKKKIFMGDAGSLLLGFVLVVTAIKLLNAVNDQQTSGQLKVLLLITGIFLVPVLDSLRVYRARVKKGISPFKADKTHLHHLFLFLNITHKTAAFFILVLVLLIISIVVGLTYLIPLIWVVTIGAIIFISVTTLLTLNRSVLEWKEKLKKLEGN